ncbi:aspartyl protease family protein [Carboxylicivirga sp. M1479]|uniref:aspartyl protease family protein n=1 Tax=Carboxylicivirga sp. M1479 TaxID=2594476 RepID=UPI0011775383|nr:aspartyl protease family protein [Carboxylicivirga sp. M1479]TRX70675.1 hypothetical protein FNN09_10400 [Carboxylicivirga sp. M1479]
MYKNYFIVFLLIVSFPCKAQFNAGSINAEKFYTELPFEYEHDKIVVEATMNGVKGRYLLDTGAMCILFKDSTEQELDVIQVMNVGDASGKKQKAEVVRLPIIEIGSLKYANIPALYVNEFAGPFKCLGYKGLIGSNLLRFGAFKIDWDQQIIIIADSFQSIGCKVDDGVKMHVNKQQSSPFAKVKVNDKNIKWVLIDTGSGDSFSLHNQTAAWLQKKNKIDAPDYISSGANSHGAWGASEHETQIFGNVNVMVGNANFSKLAVETASGQSKIGMKLLKHTNFVLDYPQKRFFFNVECNKPLSLNSFGLDLIMKDDQFIVNGVWKGTKAERLGIERGDVLEDIEGVDFKDASACEVFLTLKDQTQHQDEITFVFRKPDEKEYKKVRLQRLKF